MNYSDKFGATSLQEVSSPFAKGGLDFSTPGNTAAQQTPSGFIKINDAELLFSGNYKREGSDLVISNDVRKIVVPDYFKGEVRPTLTSRDGATLSGKIVDALTGHVTYAQASGQPEPPKEIGTVGKLTGTATAIRNGVAVDLKIGDKVYKGDVLQSGPDSALGVTFIDGTVFSLSSNARMVLNEMVYDANSTSNSSLLSLVQGTITFVAGQTAKNGNMRVDTPVATMGIRGTAVLVEIGADNGPTKFSVLIEPGNKVGQFNLYDKTTGSLIGTVSQAGQVTLVTPGGIGQQATAVELQKTLQDLQSERSIIKQAFELYFPNFNDANPQGTKGVGSSVNNLSGVLNGTVKAEVGATVLDAKFTAAGGGGSVSVTGTVGSNAPPIVITNATDIQPPEEKGGKFNIADRVGPKDDAIIPYITGSLRLDSAEGPSSMPPGFGLRGLVTFNPATGDVSYTPGDFRFLADGEQAIYTFSFQSQSGEFIFVKTLTLTIDGLNDTPVFTVENFALPVAEPTSTASNNTFSTQRTLTFTDLDFSDVASGYTIETLGVTATGRTIAVPNTATLLSFLHFNGVTKAIGTTQGVITETFTAPASAFDYLAVGESVDIIYQIKVSDADGASRTATLTVTVTGTNDAPTITGATTPASTSGDLAEDGVLIASGVITFRDVDLSNTHTAVAALTGGTISAPLPGFIPATSSLGSLSVHVNENTTDANNIGTVSWTYSLDNLVAQRLAEGQVVTQTFTVTITDSSNATVTQPVTVTITGTNDVPEVVLSQVTLGDDSVVQTNVVGAITEPLAAGAGTESANGIVVFKDLDLIDSHTASFVVKSSSATADLPGFNEGVGTTDAEGAVSYIGTFALSSSVNESGADLIDLGAVGWTFTINKNDPTLQSLAEGQTITQVYTITVTDSSPSHATVTKDVTVTITGTNDAPVIDAVVDTPLDEQTDNKPLTATIAVTFTDVDLIDIGHTATVTGVDVDGVDTGLALDTQGLIDLLVPGLVTKTGTSANGSFDLTFTAPPGTFDYLADGEELALTYTVTVDDGDIGGVSTQTVKITITGTNDAPVIGGTTQADLTEAQAGQPNATSLPLISFNDVDLADVDHTASVTNVVATGAVTGLALDDTQLKSLIGIEFVTKAEGSTNGTVTLGFSAFSFPTAFDYLATNEVLTLTYTLTIDDGDGGLASRDFVVTITGANDAPVLTVGPYTDLTAITEDDVNNAGQTVASFIGASITDADHNAVEGIAITGSQSQNGYWEFSTDGGAHWSQFGNYTAFDALLLSADDKVRFVPNGENGGIDTFSFVAWDRTTGAHGATADATNAGGTSAFSTQSGVARVEVTSVNDAPVVDIQSDNTVAVLLAEHAVPPTSGAQTNSNLLALGDGKVLVAVNDASGLPDEFGQSDSSGVGIRASLVDENGQVAGTDRVLTPSVSGDQVLVATVASSNGTGLVVWSNVGAGGAGSGGGAQIFGANGEPIGSPASIPGYVYVFAAALDDGGFVISGSADGFTNIGVTKISAGGDIVGSTYLVDSGTFNEFVVKGVAALDGGGYMLLRNGPSGGLIGQAFDASANVVGYPIQISTLTNNLALYNDLSVVNLPNEDVFITWSQFNPATGSQDIFARFLNPDGSVNGSDFAIASVAGNQTAPIVTVLANGNIAVAWFDSQNLWTSFVDAAGNILTPAVKVNSSPLALSTAGSTEQGVATADGGVFYLWRGVDGSGEGIIGRHVSASGAVDGAEQVLNANTSGQQVFTGAVAGSAGKILVSYIDVAAGDILVRAIDFVPSFDVVEQVSTSPLTLTIPVTYTDVDVPGTVHTATVTSASATGAVTGLTLTPQDLIDLIAIPGGGGGSFSMEFSAPSTAFDYLAAGDKLTLTYTVEVNDGDGGITPRTIVVTISGTNDSPTISAASLVAVNEDAANPAGQSVTALFAASFTDPDIGASFAGIAVIGDASSASQGVWQYKSPGGVWEDIGTVSADAALAFSPATMLRFVPAADFNGTPGALQVYGLDDTYDEEFTLGADQPGGRYTINTTDNGIEPLGHGGSSPVSASTVVLSTSVTPVNDAPFLDLDLVASGTGYSTNLLNDGEAFPFASSPTVTDVDDAMMTSATVVLTDGEAGDYFLVPDLASDINWVITGTPGDAEHPLTITFTGLDSASAYADAIEQVSFGTAVGGATGDRHIDVSVYDGHDDSNTATATIHVQPADNGDNNPPVAGPDFAAIGSNIIAVKSSLTLFSDTDTDNDPITIIGSSHTNDSNVTTQGVAFDADGDNQSDGFKVEGKYGTLLVFSKTVTEVAFGEMIDWMGNPVPRFFFDGANKGDYFFIVNADVDGDPLFPAFDPFGPFNNPYNPIHDIAPGEYLTDQFTYTISDGQGGTDSTTYTVRFDAGPVTETFYALGSVGFDVSSVRAHLNDGVLRPGFNSNSYTFSIVDGDYTVSVYGKGLTWDVSGSEPVLTGGLIKGLGVEYDLDGASGTAAQSLYTAFGYNIDAWAFYEAVGPESSNPGAMQALFRQYSHSISGSSGADVLYGGDFDPAPDHPYYPINSYPNGRPLSDTIDTGGGADTVYAGAGDDLIIVHDDHGWFIDGGDGIDRVRFANSVTTGVAPPGSSGENIEIFDLNKTSDFDGGAVSIMIDGEGASTINQLGPAGTGLIRIIGDSQDTVRFNDTFEDHPDGHWVLGAGPANVHTPYLGDFFTPDIFFNTYFYMDDTDTLATAYVQEGIVVSGSFVPFAFTGDSVLIEESNNNDGVTTVSDVGLFDTNPSNVLTIVATADHGTVSAVINGEPEELGGAGTTATVSEINAIFANGVTYTPTNYDPLNLAEVTDIVTVTATDSHGLRDSLHFVFQQSGEGGAQLVGTEGKDIIISTGHNDIMTGGAGRDNFVFAPDNGLDYVTDFTIGQDRIDLRQFSGVDSDNIDDWLHGTNGFTAHVTVSPNNSNDTLIDLDNGNLVTLKNIAAASLHANDFILHPGGQVA